MVDYKLNRTRKRFFLFALLLSILLLESYWIFGPSLIGYVTLRQSSTMILDKNYTDNDTEQLALPDNLNSLMLSGQLIGSGDARIYLETSSGRILILDTSISSNTENLITGNAIGETGAVENSSDDKATENIVMPEIIENASENNTDNNPISENITASGLTENNSEDIEENISANATEDISEDIGGIGNENITAYNVTDNTTENGFADSSENISENITTNIAENISETIIENNSANMTKNVSEALSIRYFQDYCKDSCLMQNISGPYTLEVEIIGKATLIINNLTYEYSPAHDITSNITTNITENISENMTLNISENITTNITENISENITTNITANLSKIDPEVLTALKTNAKLRVIIKSDKPIDTIEVSDGKVGSRLSGKNNKIAARKDAIKSFSKIKKLDLSSMMNKPYVYNLSNLVQVEQQIDNVTAVIIDNASLAEISRLDTVGSIGLDKPVTLLTAQSMNITGITMVHEQNYSGQGKKICVLDTGVNYNALGLVLNSTIYGIDIVNSDDDPMDDNGHGTEVAYILHSVAPQSVIYAVKVIDSSGIGYESDVVAGLQYCIDNHADIISMSIGAGLSQGYCDEDIVANKSNYAADLGIYVVAATGNDGSTTQIKAPSCASKVARIAASTKSDQITSFSNINDMIDLVAPGEDIITMDNAGNSISVSGTSFAVPFVSASAALILEDRSLTPPELTNLFRSTSQIIDYNGIPRNRLDAYNALINNITNAPYNYSAEQVNITEQPFGILASAGPNLPQNITNTAGVGTAAWINPLNATASDKVYTIASISSGSDTQLLNLSNFSMNIPTSAIINGIQVKVEEKASAVTSIRDDWIYLMRNYTIVGTNMSNISTWAASDYNITYGNSTYLWGTSWTYSDINALGFGLILKVRNTAAGIRQAYVDTAWITVYYTMINNTINTTTDHINYKNGDNVNASGYYMFNNGTALNNSNVTVYFINTTNLTVYTVNVTTSSSGYYSANYTIPAAADEGVWKLNVSGIYNSTMNASANTTFNVGIPPYIDSLYPANRSNITVNKLNFTCNISDNYLLKNITLYAWNSTGGIIFKNTTISAGTYNISVWNNTLPYDGNFSWNCLGYDAAGNYTWSSDGNFSIILDKTPPFINYTAMTYANISYWSRNYIIINVTATDTRLSNITIYLYNASALINTSNTSTSPNFANFTNLTQGVYYFNTTANDTYGNRNYTAKYTVTLDTQSPKMHLRLPVNQTNISVNYQNFSCNITDNFRIANLSLYVWNSTGSLVLMNYSALNGIYNLSSWNDTLPYDGNFSWNCLGYDNATNYAWASEGNYTLVQDDTVPSLAYAVLTEANNSVIPRSFIVVNVTATDMNLANITIYLYNSSFVKINSTFATSTPDFANYTGLASDTYYFNATAFDRLGNKNSTGLYNVTVDVDLPVVHLVSPTDDDNFVVNKNWSYVNASVSDENLGRAFIDWNRSLVGWWRFNNEAGENSTFFKDWSSYGNNGTCSGAACPVFTTAGKLGGAYVFDGSDYVSLGNPSSLNFDNDSFTYSVWVYLTGDMGSFDMAFSKGGYSSGESGYDMELGTGEWAASIADGTQNKRVTFDKLYNAWTLLTVVVDRESGDIYAYTNTNRSSNISIDTLGNVSNSFNAGFGEDAYLENPFNGSIDDVMIFSRALSPEEINASYDAGLFRLEHNFTNLTDGVYTYTAYAQDLAGNVNQTETRNLVVDTINPSINFTSPTDSNGSAVARSWSYVNVSVNDSNLGSAFIDWNRSLVAWYRFNNEAGENSTFFKDWSTYGNNATCAGSSCPTFTTAGKIGGAYVFDGVNNLMQVSNNSALNITGNQITLSAWVKPNGLEDPDGGAIISKDGYKGGYNIEIYLNSVIFQLTGINYTLYSTSIVNSSIWTYVVATYNGSLMMTYINGVPNTQMFRSGNIDPSSSPVFIGQEDIMDSFIDPFNGTIDDVQIFSRALSPQEINASYNAGLYRLEKNFTNLADGNYTYIAYAQDLAGNVNSTETRTLTINTVSSLGCGDLLTANTVYNLSSNVSINGLTCFNVTAANVTLDCAGYSITGNNTFNTSGLYSNQQTTTVKNCTISGFDVGIYFDGVGSGSIANNMINVTVNNNVYPAYSSGILLYNGANKNAISNTTSYSTYGAGIYLFQNSDYNNISDSSSSSDSSVGLSLQADSDYNRIINTNASSNSNNGMRFYTVSNNTLINLSSSSNSSYGIWIWSSSTNNTLVNSTFSSNTSAGIMISIGSDNNSLYSTIGNSASSSALYIDGGQNIMVDCQGRQMTGTNADNTYGIYSSQPNTTIKNCNINNFQHGIFYNGASNGTIQNNNVSLTYSTSITTYALYLKNSGQQIVSGNNLSSSGGTGAYIWTNSKYNNISNNYISGTFTMNVNDGADYNRIINNSMYASSGNGLYISSSNNWVENNSVYAVWAPAIYVEWNYGEPDYNTIINNTAISPNGVALEIASGRYNNFTNNYLQSGNSFAAFVTGLNPKYNIFKAGTANGTIAIYLSNTASNTFSDMILYSSGYAAYVNYTANTTIANNTFVSPSSTLAFIESHSSGNTFYWNNFTATSGLYANDTNGSNYYNTTIGGHSEGNVWANVMNDSVQIKGASISQYGSGLYYGTSGSGYPYNSSNSLGKLSGNVVDYAPLTAILSMPLSINFTSPTPANNTNTTNTSVIINVSINTSSLNNFIWNWNGTNYSLYNNSIVLMMNFDNNSNIGDSASQATDVSIYGNNGTITNALWSNTGVHGGSIRFNGAGDYITLPTDKIFYDILAPHATTFWLYINTYAGNGYPTVLNLLATQGMYYAIYASNNGTYEGISITETSGASFRAAGISGGLVGSWNHVAIVFDGVDRTQASSWKIYLNGVPQTVSAGGSWTTFANNILGTDDASATHTINGNLDDLTIWNRSLTASEVQQLYRSSFQKIYPNYWQFTANESNLTLRNYTYYAYANDANSNSGQTETRYINIMSPSNTPPVITNVATLGAQNPVEKGLSTFSINFTVNDNDGNATINVSSAKVFVNISGLFRNSTSCSGSAINSTAINVSCNVSLQYYDPAGLWSINVSISDNSGDYAENITSTFTYNELASISLSANNLNFGLLTTGAANQTTNPLIINNSGNVNFVNISIKAFELANGTSYIGVGNFTVNVSNATGMMLANNTLMDIAGSYINRNNDTMQTNQTLYFYVSVPSSLPSKNYYSVSGWMIVANK